MSIGTGRHRMRLLAVVQQNASVLRVGLDQSPLVRSCFVSVMSDRACAATEMVRTHGFDPVIRSGLDNRAYSDAILEHAREVDADGIVLFMGRILSGPLLSEFENRIINIHPSLLPAFKGLHSVDETLAAGVRFVGSTFHFIDEQVDEGRMILQSAAPFDWAAEESMMRSRQFALMCQGLVQVVSWWRDGRIEIAGSGTRIRGARFDEGAHSPNLDEPEALGLRFDH
jgi:phosphoribosylglycinamide formyltransferase-1